MYPYLQRILFNSVAHVYNVPFLGSVPLFTLYSF